MIVTPFGNMSWEDKDSIQPWIDAHDQRHFSERQRIAMKGIPLFARNFQGPINAEWFGRHMLEHSVLKDFSVPDSTINSVSMEMQWTDEQQFYRWHQMHNLLHERLDRALGIYA